MHGARCLSIQIPDVQEIDEIGEVGRVVGASPVREWRILAPDSLRLPRQLRHGQAHRQHISTPLTQMPPWHMPGPLRLSSRSRTVKRCMHGILVARPTTNLVPLVAGTTPLALVYAPVERSRLPAT